MSSREVREGLQTQGPDESVSYRINVRPAAVSAGAVTVTDETGADVTASTCTGSATVSDGALILPALHDLEESRFYTVEAAYTDVAGNVIMPLFRVLCG